MRLRAYAFGALLALVFSTAVAAAPHDRVVIPAVKTSIYVGSVTLISTPLERRAAIYHASYKAKVFPYFFFSEEGELAIEFSDDQIARLGSGERVAFTGTAKNKEGEDRRVEGHVTASAPGAREGTIKVRIFVSPKIELIFNSTYAFKGE